MILKKKCIAIVGIYVLSCFSLKAQKDLGVSFGLNSNLFYYYGSNYYGNNVVSGGINYQNRYNASIEVGYVHLRDKKDKLEESEEIRYFNLMVSTRARFLSSKHRFSPLAEVNFGWGGKPFEKDVRIGGNYEVVKYGSEQFIGYFKQISYFAEFKAMLDVKFNRFSLQSGLGWRVNNLIYENWLTMGGPEIIHTLTGGWIISAGVQYVIPMKGK